MEPRKMFSRMSDLRKVLVREVIYVERVVGEGTEENPARRIVEIYEMDGKLIARRDDGFEQLGCGR